MSGGFTPTNTERQSPTPDVKISKLTYYMNIMTDVLLKKVNTLRMTDTNANACGWQKPFI